ncbi:serine/threonine-protein kinase RsbW [Isoptericola sp. CG 20/1183]|uniref:Serine/threonine-protein kinase RsbW n=1 Tax=Isoptericola halotolerans TaxID=300560 RepID=A0ABX5EB70_9MICO|nr:MULTISPECIES: PP2C family protein-serine/threonine phosphatase [Isoptericola]PRZ04479.1 serine/threonine-protein kinase RsbW [Isoptericola halotolerans]PRZ04623.1 serine/threonine-protein kinase RsbW [Isoptericola sp. CG 20/1183]
MTGPASNESRAWSTAPLGLLHLDADGYVLRANDTFVGWVAGQDAGTGVAGRRIGDLLTVGGRIYWDTHVAPALTLAGQVEAVRVEVRTAAGPLPALLTARTRPRDGAIDVALLAVRRRAEFEQELVRARSAAERSTERLRWVQHATAALSHAAGPEQVRAALLAAVAAHPGVAAVRLQTAGGLQAGDPTGGRHPGPDGRLSVPVAGAAGTHGDLVVQVRGRPAEATVDVDALATIAQQGGVALDRALLHERSMSVAHELQHAMLTIDLPHREDVTVSAGYRPADSGMEVGGDWYDAFWVAPAVLALVVGDVVGHGLLAATAMGQLRTATRALAGPGLGPGRVLDRVDGFVVDRETGFGSTLVYAELDTGSGVLAYACAGHLPPLHVTDAGAEFLWEGRSTPLGVHHRRVGPPRRQGRVRLAAGDTVLLYTDGVVERRDVPLTDGLAGLARTAGRPAAGAALTTQVLDAGPNRRDDACVLAVTWSGTAGT